MDVTIKKTIEEWKAEIEAERLEDYKNQLKAQSEIQAEYSAYIESYKSYSYEEMRDYGHTWGPGFEPEKPEPTLPDYYKVEGRQKDILEQMISLGMADEDIRYIFLNKCAWDDEYPICELGNEYRIKDVLMELIERWKTKAKWYEEKMETKQIIWADQEWN